MAARQGPGPSVFKPASPDEWPGPNTFAANLARFCVQFPPLGGPGYGEKIHESEYVVCPCCGDYYAARARGITLETFECKPCGVAVTAEAVSGTHMLIEKTLLLLVSRKRIEADIITCPAGPLQGRVFPAAVCAACAGAQFVA